VAKLIVEDPARTLLLDLQPGESLRVGRSSECDVRITAPRASRRHCAVLAAGDGHEIEDLGSTNGTTLNGALFAGRVRLADGDVVDAAGCRLVYRARP
jgi:pSer/pThr/pTyr-binding forkhead associated (FHA) protein